MFKKRKTFGEVVDMWLTHNRIHLKGGTITKYQNMIDTHIMPGLGKYKLSQLNSTMINVYLNEKLEKGRLDSGGGLSSSYVNSLRVVINSVIQFAVEEELMNPLRTQVRRPSSEKKELQTLSKEEQRQLEVYLTEDITPTKLGVLLSLHTGLRIGEVCALSWEDINVDHGVIHVRHTVARVRNETEVGNAGTMLIIDSPKTTASRRDIPISSLLLPYIKRVKETSCSSYVISSQPQFVSPRTYEYRFHRILEDCRISSINYHVLRHTFATRCIEVGVDVKSLSEILGHANVGITLNTYVHSSMELKRQQMEKIAKAIA